MDFAEAVYISELRTTPAGHVSYRNVAYAMYEAVAKKYPALAKYFRVHDVRRRWICSRDEVVTFAYTSDYLVRYHDLAVRWL